MLLMIYLRRCHFSHHICRRLHSSSVKTVETDQQIQTIALLGQDYKIDNWTNVRPNIIEKLNRNLHNRKYHPLYLIRKKIQNFFYQYTNRLGNPMFSVYDNISPIVTLEQNYDSLLVPKDHPSRKPSDCYYVNQEWMLRAHTSAHQRDLIRSGLDRFIVIGDVYRRDEIDSSHFPVFHQAEGVRLFSQDELFKDVQDPTNLFMLEDGKRLPEKQAEHTMEAAKLLEHDLKTTLVNLAFCLFGNEIETRWVEAYFPFTHPSWELEIMYKNDWMEVLGCGVMAQQILQSAGAGHKVGWAFGLGLERLAMKLYNIPDIRLFWSEDSGFLSQFHVEDPNVSIQYKPISQYPQCINDMSFWLNRKFAENDFYDLVRHVGGDIVEQVYLVDDFFHAKKQLHSQCYRIVYRHMEKILTQKEVNEVHQKIEQEAVKELGVTIR